MICWAFTATLLLAAPPEVRLTTLAEERAEGVLVRLDADGATLATTAGERAWPLADLLALEPLADAPARDDAPARVWIELIDGSRLEASAWTVAEGVARVRLRSGGALDIPTRSLRHVRWQSHETELARHSQLARQWREIVEDEPAGDVIVIRKLSMAGDEGAERPTAALDLLEGVLGDITEDKVQFTFDDQVIPVDRGKVEGVRYFHPAGRELPAPICRVDDRAGSRWLVKSLAWREERLHLATSAGVKVELPLAEVARLDFSAGKIVYLSDVEPETALWTSAYGPSAASANLARMFAPRRDESLTGGPLVVAGRSYEKGLALHSQTRLEYRLAGAFQRFQAVAAIAPDARPAGDVQLVVELDGKTLGEHRITGRDDAATRLDYDIRGGRKLTIRVEFGAALDLGDHLHLGNARVTK